MPAIFHLRQAQPADISALEQLIASSVRGLMPQSYASSQLEAALGTWLGVDSQLVQDGTYFIVETEHAGRVLMVGCGGWSKRKTPYGSDNRPGREDTLLDAANEAARIRAFFVHPEWTRQGIGTLILNACERAAREAGFLSFELGATLSGVPLYKKRGYIARESINLPLANGENFVIVRMTKE
ncbi:MAG TPA: GNAT family N-acetyltransferase [Terriglobales bacterium]|jgi:GNAT superfamily N-acetyltransferase|nr:GNAT family N-acetyltransferase [Terriglobales bacterium]